MAKNELRQTKGCTYCRGGTVRRMAGCPRCGGCGFIGAHGERLTKGDDDADNGSVDARAGK